MGRNHVFTLILTFVLAVTASSTAGDVPAPQDPPEGVTVISVTDAKQLIDEKKVRVFDMRKALNYGKGHLPGAVSLPYKWTTKGPPGQRTGSFEISKLPSDKKAMILFHSDGPNGWKSYYSAKSAREAGYGTVMWMREGIEGWKERGYPLEY